MVHSRRCPPVLNVRFQDRLLARRTTRLGRLRPFAGSPTNDRVGWFPAGPLPGRDVLTADIPLRAEAGRYRNGGFQVSNADNQTFGHGDYRWQVATRIGSSLVSARVARLAESHTLAQRFPYEPVAISRQFFEQPLCFLQIGRREALGEPVINWCQKPIRFFAASLIAPQSRKAGRGA
jgi:hypothetical protein